MSIAAPDGRSGEGGACGAGEPPPHAPSRAALIRRAIALVSLFTSSALALLAIWTLVPAPTEASLPLGVIAPEWSPYFAVLGLTLATLGVTLRRGRAGFVTLGLSAAAIMCCIPALASYPAVVTEADARLADLAGDRGWTISPYDPLALAGHDDVSIDDDVPVPLRDGTTTLALDLYRPNARGPHPAIVVVYGGAWAFGDKRDCRALGIDLARAGYVVATVEYRHAPRFQYPTQLEDVQDALALLQKEHAAWDVDPQRVALLGRSSGAEIALVLASTPEPVRIAAAVGLYAPIDLVAGYADPPEPDPTNVRAILRRYLGGPPDAAHVAAYRNASPQTYARALKVPALLLTGGADELVLPQFQRRYADSLEAADTPTVALELPYANHAFDEVPLGRGLTFERAVLLRFLGASLSNDAAAGARSGRAGRRTGPS